MNRKDLYESIGNIDDFILERSEKNKDRKKRTVIRWMSTAAAVLIIIVSIGTFFETNEVPEEKEKDSVIVTEVPSETFAIQQAVYPEVVAYPNQDKYLDSNTGEYDYEGYEKAYYEWKNLLKERTPEEGFSNGLEKFFEESIQAFLSESSKENTAYSPLNVYMALGMLAELTDGNSRQQILELMNAKDIESLRKQANMLWNAHYRKDGATTSVLASSLWLNQDISFVPTTMEILRDSYYASAFQGKMGSPELNGALHAWLNEQTGDLLKEQVKQIEMKEDTIMTLATTIFYQAKWMNEFPEENTREDVFHGAEKNTNCEFMNSKTIEEYYRGDQFSAVKKNMDTQGGSMYFILPDKGVSIKKMLKDSEVMDFILSGKCSSGKEEKLVNLSVPKFDISSTMDLKSGLETMGVTDVFDSDQSDFSPMTTEKKDIFVSKVQHDVRVKIDEEGVEAVAYTVMMIAESAAMVENEINFVLDRPFLFVITSNHGLPLFVGVVNQP